MGAPGTRVLAFSIFLRSCGGAGKRRGFASGVRVIGCPGPLARAVWSSPGGEGRSGHCSNHSHHRHSRRPPQPRPLGKSLRAAVPWIPDEDWGATLCSLRAEPCWPRARNHRARQPRPDPVPFLASAQLSAHATPWVSAGPSRPCPGRLLSGPLGHCCCCCCRRCPATPRASGGARTQPRTTPRWRARRARSSSWNITTTRAKPVGAAGSGQVQQKFAFEMQMRRWASLHCRLWGGSALPPPLPEVPRAPLENNAPEEWLQCHSDRDVRAPGLRCARRGGRGSVSEANPGNEGGCPRPAGRGAGAGAGSPDSQVVSTGHRRTRGAAAGLERSGGLGAAFPGSDAAAGSQVTAFVSFAQSFPTSCG